MITFTQEDIFLVTGASSGIGKSISLKLNQAGATVIAVGRDEKKLQYVQKEAVNPDAIKVVVRNLTENMDEIPAFVRNLCKHYGKFSGMVYSAGAVDIVPVMGLEIERAKKLFDINYFAALACARGFGNKINHKASSSIVFLSSVRATLGYDGMSNYAATKGAINSFVKSLAIEFARTKLRVNSIMPGHIETEMALKYNDIYSEAYKSEIESMYPLGKGEPEDIANAAIFLLSPLSRWITGQSIIIDGGRSLM